MIYDRTRQDVENAKKIRKNKIQKYQSLTETELDTIEKGFVTLSTLNRIETAQHDVMLKLQEIGYWDNTIINKEWSLDDIFNNDDLNRIVNNISALRKSFFVYRNTPRNPFPLYSYVEFNYIEKIIVDIENAIADIKKKFLICGTFICGEESL